MPQARKIVEHLTLRTLARGRKHTPLLDRPHLFESQRITLDRRRSVDITCPRVFLQGRYPRQLDRRRLDAFAQGRYLLAEREHARCDRELRRKTHTVSQA